MLVHQIQGFPRFTIPATSGLPVAASKPRPALSK